MEGAVFFHLVWVAGLEFGGAVCFIWFGLVVWRGRFFNLVWVAGLEGPLVSFSFVWLRGGAVFSIRFGLVVWRGPCFPLVWVAGLVGLVIFPISLG